MAARLPEAAGRAAARRAQPREEDLKAVRIPPALVAEWRREPEWLDDCRASRPSAPPAWDLELEEPYDTPRSLVVPAGGAVLKLNAPSHFEADHEADALACWDGQGAVRLLARDDGRRALLLERCVPGTTSRAEGRRDGSIILGLLERLPAPPRAITLSAPRRRSRALDRGSARAVGGRRPAVRALAPRGRDRGVRQRRSRRERTRQPGPPRWNVLRSEREPWLVIDPKPLVGEREVDGVGPLRERGVLGRRRRRRPLARRACRPRDGPRAASRLGLAHAIAWGFDHGRWSTRSIEAARTISRA